MQLPDDRSDLLSSTDHDHLYVAAHNHHNPAVRIALPYKLHPLQDVDSFHDASLDSEESAGTIDSWHMWDQPYTDYDDDLEFSDLRNHDDYHYDFHRGEGVGDLFGPVDSI